MVHLYFEFILVGFGKYSGIVLSTLVKVLTYPWRRLIRTKKTYQSQAPAIKRPRHSFPFQIVLSSCQFSSPFRRKKLLTIYRPRNAKTKALPKKGAQRERGWDGRGDKNMDRRGLYCRISGGRRNLQHPAFAFFIYLWLVIPFL